MEDTKILRINASFTKSSAQLSQDGSEVYIEGYASTNDADRHGDVVPTGVWEKGLVNYLKNPVILAFHDHKQPCGRMVDYKIDSKGLWIKAKILSSAKDVFNLVKDGILTAFSIGFRLKDAEYNAATELFVVKELELHEISVVAIPANQNSLFELSKAFDSAEDYKSFKLQFAANKSIELELANGEFSKEMKMDKQDLEKALAAAAEQAAQKALQAVTEAQAKAAREAEEKALQEKAFQERVSAAVKVTVGESGTEKLLAEVEKRLSEQAESQKAALAGLESAIKEKAAELQAIQGSKMSFSTDKSGMSYDDKEKAVLLSKMTGKAIDGTRLGRQMVEKYGAHVPSATWETEVSLRMEDEVRRRLIISPLLRNITMQTNVMTIPVNPEAGVATWVTNAQFGTSNSAGSNATHALKEITLNAYKVATNEYLAYEEEEDSLLALLPVVRDAMVRRVARAVDRAFLRGAGAGSDPVKGLVTYDASSAVTLDISDAAKATVATMRSLRKDLGAWGLDPADVVYVVSQDVYYDLLDDTTFQTMNQVGTQATLLTGQIGSIGNSPVLVSGEFADKADGAAGAVAFCPANFLVGNQRGLRMDTQDLVETQRKVMVASLRTGLVQTTTNLGGAVSALRYIA